MEEIQYIDAKTLVSNYASNNQWFGTNYNMNIYKGCCHGCIYCDSRSDCYRIVDFDQVKVKKNCLEIIRNDLRSKRKKGVVATGSMSDPYNPLEAKLELSRHALELISAYEFGVAIATKSPLITRDIDILQEIKEYSPVICKMTITTFDDNLSKIIEPHVAPSSLRFAAIEKLAKAGIYSGVLLMPVLPYITDKAENIEEIVKRSQDVGAKFIYAGFGMTLRNNQRDYYYKMLDLHFPDLKDKYIKNYGSRYNCTSPHAKKLWYLFANSCTKHGIAYKMSDIIKQYKDDYTSKQLSLF